jgi:hypothetical protein
MLSRSLATTALLLSASIAVSLAPLTGCSEDDAPAASPDMAGSSNASGGTGGTGAKAGGAGAGGAKAGGAGVGSGASGGAGLSAGAAGATAPAGGNTGVGGTATGGSAGMAGSSAGGGSSAGAAGTAGMAGTSAGGGAGMAGNSAGAGASAGASAGMAGSSAGNSAEAGAAGAAGAGTGTLGFTPWALLDAEGGTVGQPYQWSDADGGTTVDDTHVFEGKHAFKMHAKKGTPGGGQFGSWGGIETLPSALKKGDTLHVQYSTYFPSDFDWTANPWLKFVRVHVNDVGGKNVGYNDIYIYNDGTLHNIYEGGAGPTYWADTTTRVEKDVWETFELEITFDELAVDFGGQGRTKFWKRTADGMILMMDRTDSNTLKSPTDTVDRFHFFTYWNSGPNEDGMYPTHAQDCWVDRVVFEKDLGKLVEHDAAGNPIIGGF